MTRRKRVPDAVNLHATACVLGERGVLITGPSGSGKTLLALSLVERERLAGRFARLVADDQVFATVRSGRIVVFAPAAIEGLAEVRGFGPVGQEYEPAAVIDLEVQLLPDGPAERYQVGKSLCRLGVELPSIFVTNGELEGAIHAVRAALTSPDSRG
jgi:hypothetical protein